MHLFVTFIFQYWLVHIGRNHIHGFRCGWWAEPTENAWFVVLMSLAAQFDVNTSVVSFFAVFVWLRLQAAQMMRCRDLVIFMPKDDRQQTMTEKKRIALPLVHACGVITWYYNNYSGKFSREETFTDFELREPFMKVFFMKFVGDHTRLWSV